MLIRLLDVGNVAKIAEKVVELLVGDVVLNWEGQKLIILADVVG